MPRQVLAYRADLSPVLVEAIEETLLAMAQEVQGKEILTAFQGTTKFDRMPQGPAETFRVIEDMIDLADL